MSNVQFVSLAEATNLVKTCGATNTFLIEGPPGVGKSSILKSFDSDTYELVYFDAAIADLGDIQFPCVSEDRDEVTFLPNAVFKIKKARQSGKPLAVMIDELGKAPKAVMNALLPLLLEKRLGIHALPEGSIVFATTNLATDGVGDNIPAHARNRVTTLHTYGPKVNEWINWAVEANIDPVVVAWVHENPSALACYAQGAASGRDPKSNPYIFNPLAGVTKTFCSPRSLAHAGPIVGSRDKLGSAFNAALAGTIGAAAAADMDAFIKADDSMATWKEIIETPTTAKLPEGITAYIQAIKCAMKFDFDRKTADAVLTYAQRWKSEEARSLFFNVLCRRDAVITRIHTHPVLAEMSLKYLSLHNNG